MKAMNDSKKIKHHGHAIKRIRHTLGIKQDVLATSMGISQALVSFYENKPMIEDETIEKFAKALHVAPTFIKELEEDPVIVIIENNTLYEGDIIAHIAGDNTNNYNPDPDPVGRIIQLSNEKTALYERMLELEKEKNILLEEVLRKEK